MDQPPSTCYFEAGIVYNLRRKRLQAATAKRNATMGTELLVNYNQFWARLSQDIAAAERSVFVQTFALEGDSVGKQLSAALLSAQAKDKRILADSFTRFVLSDKLKYSPANLCNRELRREARETDAMKQDLESAGVQIRFTNPVGVTPRRILSRNHKKLIVLDERVAYIGGINFSEHNAGWHDMMLRVEDAPAAEFLGADFLATWDGRDETSQRQFAGLELFTLDGRVNRQAFQRVLDLIDGARQTIFVESPYISFPFYERLRLAARRGVAVTLMTPEQNNWRFFRNYARLESARSQIDLRLYLGGMSHLKAMLVDDEFLVAGSSNFDYFSYRIHQEILGIFTDRNLISEFRRRVMLPDLANARGVECKASLAGQQLLNLQMRLLDAALTVLT
ncbi:MAG: phosphatidylserine/phosphatidylglycerophosphate/cardiolipin synthase family protein [Acidobacteriota bacterium]